MDFQELLGIKKSFIKTFSTDKVTSVLYFDNELERFYLDKYFILTGKTHTDSFFNTCENIKQILEEFSINDSLDFSYDKIIAVCFNENNHKFLMITSDGRFQIKTLDLKTEKTYILDFTQKCTCKI